MTDDCRVGRVGTVFLCERQEAGREISRHETYVFLTLTVSKIAEILCPEHDSEGNGLGAVSTNLVAACLRCTGPEN